MCSMATLTVDRQALLGRGRDLEAEAQAEVTALRLAGLSLLALAVYVAVDAAAALRSPALFIAREDLETWRGEHDH